MGAVFPLKRRVPCAEPTPSPRGEVYVCPTAEDGGSWLIIHESASGNSAAFLGTRFALDDAIDFGRAEAKRLGANFIEGMPL